MTPLEVASTIVYASIATFFGIAKTEDNPCESKEVGRQRKKNKYKWKTQHHNRSGGIQLSEPYYGKKHSPPVIERKLYPFRFYTSGIEKKDDSGMV
jgi:hypothetical protein